MHRVGRNRAVAAILVLLLGSGAGTAAAQTSTGETLAPAAAAQFEIRLQQLEQQMRQLTGQIEELTFNVHRLEGQLERSRSDMEMRLQMGQSGATDENLASTGGAVVVTPEPSSQGMAPNQSTGEVPSTPVVTAAAPAVTTAPSTSIASPSGATVLPQGQPAEDYNNAYALLQQADYAGAERAFSAFLAAHPNDPLAGNAQYWFAETFYVRENYHQAAIQFAEGYKKYPDGPKAAANLLKLGMSLGRLGKTSEACASLDELERRFPDAPGNVQNYARTERQRLGCG
jgi:tol-pal system protein YbgF